MSKSQMRRINIQKGATCQECGCFDHVHGGCKSKGHGPECHGVHTMWMCGDFCKCCGAIDSEDDDG